MTIIKIKRIKIAILISAVVLVLLSLLSALFMVISDRKNKAEETPVLIPPPENVMFPPMLFKTSSLSGTKYRMDEEGNVLLKNDDEALYKMTPLKELYKADEYGDFIRVYDEDEVENIYNTLSKEQELAHFFTPSLEGDNKSEDEILSEPHSPSLYQMAKEMLTKPDESKKFTLSLSGSSPSFYQNTEGREEITPFSSTSSDFLKSLAENSEYTAQNSQNEKERFISGYDKSVETSGNKHMISKGVMIPITLITGVNTDLPGLITAQISSNIYDSYSGENIILEKGTKIIGKYDSRITYNQNRISTVWNTIVTNNGDNITVPPLIGVDKNGQSGWGGKVDNHRTQSIVTSVLSGLLNLGSASLANSMSSTLLTLLGSGINSSLNAFGTSFINKELNRQPTITIDKGEQMYLMTTSPITITKGKIDMN